MRNSVRHLRSKLAKISHERTTATHRKRRTRLGAEKASVSLQIYMTRAEYSQIIAMNVCAAAIFPCSAYSPKQSVCKTQNMNIPIENGMDQLICEHADVHHKALPMVDAMNKGLRPTRSQRRPPQRAMMRLNMLRRPFCASQ